MNSTINKRSYHPLFQYLFYIGSLSKEQIDSIPKTTRDYWKLRPHNELFGYAEIQHACKDFENFHLVQKHRIIFRSAIFFCRITFAFQQILGNLKGHKKILRNNLALITNTIDYLSLEIPLDKACKVFNITTTQYYRWKNKVHCTASVLNLCYKTHPGQLTIQECSVIQSELGNPDNQRKKLTTIFYGLLRQGKLYCSRPTFYKYCHLLVGITPKPKKHSKTLRLKASRVFEYIHLDTTLIPTLEGTIRAVMFKDNYSKHILLQAIVEDAKSSSVVLLAKKLIEWYHLLSHQLPITFVSDGGPENKGELSDWIENLDAAHIYKSIAQTIEFRFSNNQIESAFNIFKNEFLDRNQIIKSKEEAVSLLSQFQHYNNNLRFPGELYGLSPQEVLDGQIPDPKRFYTQIKEARQLRYSQNKQQENHCSFCAMK